MRVCWFRVGPDEGFKGFGFWGPQAQGLLAAVDEDLGHQALPIRRAGIKDPYDVCLIPAPRTINPKP